MKTAADVAIQDLTPGPPPRAWIAWAAVCVIWGTTYLGIKVALETVPPFVMGGFRYTIAGKAPL